IAPQVKHPLLAATILDLLNARLPDPKTGVGDVIPIQSLTKKEIQSRELEGMHGLVTGSTSGIGKAIAMELIGAGADVIFHGRRPEGRDRLQESGINYPILLRDLRNPEARGDLATTAWDMHQGLDFLINNAGADTLTGEATHQSFDQKLQELLEV